MNDEPNASQVEGVVSGAVVEPAAAPATAQPQLATTVIVGQQPVVTEQPQAAAPAMNPATTPVQTQLGQSSPVPIVTQEPCPSVPWKPAHGTWALLLSLGILAAGLLIPLIFIRLDNGPTNFGTARLVSWLAVLGLMMGLLVVLGRGITGLGRGVFIDDRNFISLSRLQMVLWTVLILSGWIAIVLSNYALALSSPEEITKAMNVSIPNALWGAMGISIASLLGAPLLLSNKASTGADGVEAGQTLQVLNQTATNTNVPSPVFAHDGQVLTKNCPCDSRLSDVFRGEETGNGDHVDLAKVQMFLFTLILIGGYAIAIAASIYTADPTKLTIDSLPALSSSFVALLALSHAGYLGNKAVPHSKTGDSN